ncbi:MAG: response regulator [bacterium]
MKVLLVDDSKAARFAMRNLLEKEGLEVEIAETGEEALEKLGEELVDIVFMDQSMPGMGGIEATRQIKSGDATRDIPVVLCTGNEGDKLEEMAAEAGAVGVLTKPPQAEKLREILGSLGGAPAEEVVEEAAPEEAAAFDESAILAMLDNAVGPLKERIENAFSEAQAMEQALRSKISEAVSGVEKTVGAKLDKATSQDSSDFRIEFEELRQQMEGKLDDVHNKATQLAQNLSGETTRRAEALINQRISELKDTVEHMESVVAESTKRTEAKIASMESGILTKAAVMVVVMGALLAAAGFFLLK